MSEIIWKEKFQDDWHAFASDEERFGILHLRKGNRRMYEKMIVLSNGKDLDTAEWLGICNEYINEHIRKSEKV